jgi:phage baseplate assembly protein W
VSTSITYPYTINVNGTVSSSETSTRLYLDRILTLVSTYRGQRPMLPDYGIDWSGALFENDNDARLAIPVAIREAVALWIPEVEVTDINIRFDPLAGIQYVTLGVELPDDTFTTMSINTATFNMDGTVTY